MNKKRLISLVLALVLVLSINLVAFADSTQNATESTDSANTTITTVASAVYLVSIPSTVTITAYDTNDQTFGTISLNTAQSRIHASGYITVALASGEHSLKNLTTPSDTAVPFVIKQNSSEFTSANLSTSNTSFDLKIQVPEWTNTKAGSFSGSVTFNISYTSGL